MLKPDDHRNAPIHLQLVGQMKATTADNKDILPVGRKLRALLAVIVMSAPEPVMRRRLEELLWSGRSRDQQRASLRQEIHRLSLALIRPNPDFDILDIRRDRIGFYHGVISTDVDPNVDG